MERPRTSTSDSGPRGRWSARRRDRSVLVVAELRGEAVVSLVRGNRAHGADEGSLDDVLVIHDLRDRLGDAVSVQAQRPRRGLRAQAVADAERPIDLDSVHV